MPFCVTEAARDELIEMLERVDAPDHRAARFVVRGDRLKLTIDERRSGDAAVRHAGRTVLVLDEQVAGLLDGQQLDKADLSGAGGRLKRRGLTISSQAG